MQLAELLSQNTDHEDDRGHGEPQETARLLCGTPFNHDTSHDRTSIEEQKLLPPLAGDRFPPGDANAGMSDRRRKQGSVDDQGK